MRVNWEIKEGRELKERLEFLAKRPNNYAAVDTAISAMAKLRLIPSIDDVERFLESERADYEDTYVFIPYLILQYITQLLYYTMEDIEHELRNIDGLSKEDYKYTLLAIYAILSKCTDLIEERGFCIRISDLSRYRDEMLRKIDQTLEDAVKHILESLDSLKEHFSHKLKEDFEEISNRVKDSIESIKGSLYKEPFASSQH